MPLKCSIKGCKSNYDSTEEKVTVFAFPSNEVLLEKWLERIEIKGSAITKFSRICIKHFQRQDIIEYSANRKLLRANALPFMMGEQSSELNIEKMIEEDDTSQGNFIENFEEFCVGVEERFSHINDLHTYINTDGCCIYQLSPNDQFTDVLMRLKICVNKNFKVTVINEGIEQDVSSIVSNSQLLYWSHFYAIVEKYYDQRCESLIEEPEPELDANKIIEELAYDEESDGRMELESDNYLLETASAVEYIENDFLENDEDDQLVEEMVECESLVNIFKCRNCLITFKNEMGLSSHSKTCVYPKKIAVDHQSKTCNHCQKEFPTVKGLKTHMKAHFSAKNVKCHYCDLIMYSGSLNRHIRSVHLKERPHKCSICSKAFSTVTLKNTHEKTHERNVDVQKYLCIDQSGLVPLYQCPKCNECFEKSDGLKTHLSRNCYRPPKKRAYKYPCNICHKQYPTKGQAAQHLLSAHNIQINNPLKYCFECCAEFEDYVNHIRIHTCQFNCKFCGMKFLTEEKCLQHEQQKHENEDAEDRPHQCPIINCNASFKTPHHLKSHISSIHNEAERHFVCDTCNNRFSSKALLNAHARTHSKDYTIFDCKLCGKHFKKLTALKIHSQAVHQIEEIYFCTIDDCQERYKFLTDLKLHRQQVHNMNLNVQKYFHEKNE